MLRNKRGHDSERPAHHDEEWPPLATTRESPSTETKIQHSNQSINKNLKKKNLKKNTLEGINNRITEAEERISELEEKMVEITAREQNKEKRMKRIERPLGQH